MSIFSWPSSFLIPIKDHHSPMATGKLEVKHSSSCFYFSTSCLGESVRRGGGLLGGVEVMTTFSVSHTYSRTMLPNTVNTGYKWLFKCKLIKVK